MRSAPVAVALLGLLAARSPAPADDWPMLGHDAARSGATREVIRPPLERAWYRIFPDEGIPAGAQPVVADGVAYLGTLHGSLHAIDLESGLDRWTFRAGGPILHAAAVADGRVVFGTMDGTITALDARTGKPAWRHPTGAAVWNAPVVHEGRAVVGSRDGIIYCFNVHSINMIWKTPLGAPILNSPAIDAARNRAYVGAEDMTVRALDLAEGRILWTSPKLPGVSLRGYHPVIAPDGAVIVTVQPFAGGDAMQNVLLDMVKEVFGDFASWRHGKEENDRLRAANFALMANPKTYEKQIAYLRDRLTAEPALQTTFVLDPDSGRPRFVAPIVYAESMNGPAAPPVVTPDGRVIVKYSALLRSRYEHYSPFLNVGSLDTRTGAITPIMDQSRTYGWHDSLLLVHDEQCQLAVAGRLLLNTHQDNVNALDLDTLEGTPFPLATNVHEVEPGRAAAHWATVLHGKEIPRGWEWLPRGTAVYGGGSALDTSVVVADGTLLYIPMHEINAGAALIAYRPAPGGQGSERAAAPTEALTAADVPAIRAARWDWDTLDAPRLDHALAGLPELPAGTRRRPLTDEAAAAVAAIADADLDHLIDTPAWPSAGRASPPVDPAHAAIARELEAAVRERVETDWRPLLFPAAKAPAEAYRLFTDPAATLETLALAYPFLGAETRGEVVAFVERMQGAGGPLADPTAPRPWPADAGAIRSRYDPAPASLVQVVDEPIRGPTEALYPLWLWAHVRGEWRDLDAAWPSLRDRIDTSPDLDASDLGNARLAGLIAACRLAHRVGDTEAEAQLRRATREAIRARLRYELAHTEGGLITREGNRSVLGRWHRLTPDVAAVLRVHAAPIHRHLMDVMIDHHRPTWPLAWNVELLWRNEAPFGFPDLPRDVLLARAWILDEPADALARVRDLPWCQGDEDQVAKLAAIVGRATPLPDGRQHR